MTELEFQTALKEFFDNDNVVTYLPYHGPKFKEKTFNQKGYVFNAGAKQVNLKDRGLHK